MATTIANTSVETVKELILKEFHSFTQIWQSSERKRLIQTAKDFGLTDLAIEMENDLN
jgi:diacylglycerol kinase